MRRTILSGVAMLTLLASGIATAQVAAGLKAEEIIAARQAGFDLQAGVANAMKAAVEAKLDVKLMEDGAKGLAAWGRTIPTLFPEGTQTGGNTKALPAIWSDRAGFEKAAANFVEQADKLKALAAANDKEGFATQFKTTTEACGACHRPYRARAS